VSRSAARLSFSLLRLHSLKRSIIVHFALSASVRKQPFPHCKQTRSSPKFAFTIPTMSESKIVISPMSPFPRRHSTLLPQGFSCLSALSNQNPEVIIVVRRNRAKTGSRRRKSGSKMQLKSNERQGEEQGKTGGRTKNNRRKIGGNDREKTGEKRPKPLPRLHFSSLPVNRFPLHFRVLRPF